MMRSGSFAALFLMMMSGLSLVACDPKDPAGVTVVGIEITPVNPTATQGQTLQFHATETLSDGTSVDVTDAVMWESTDTSVLAFDTPATPGLASLPAAGSVTVKATDATAGQSKETSVNVASVPPIDPSYHVTVVSQPGDAMFIGCDNQLDIHVKQNGVEVPAIVSASGATVSAGPTPGRYVVRVATGTTFQIDVAVDDGAGGQIAVGSYPFRTKRGPRPSARIGTLTGDGQMTDAEVANIRTVFVDPDEEMDRLCGGATYRIVSFVMSMNVNGVYVDKKANGQGVTADMMQMLATARPGNKIIFEQITAQGPDGRLEKLSPLVIKVR